MLVNFYFYIKYECNELRNAIDWRKLYYNRPNLLERNFRYKMLRAMAAGWNHNVLDWCKAQVASVSHLKNC